MTTDQTAYVEVLARLLCAADGHVYGDDHPTWQQLSAEPGGRVQDDYRKAARWLAARLTVSSVGQAPATSQTALIALGAEAIRAAACPGSDCPHTEEECAEQRIQPAAWERGVLSEVYGRPEWFADAVLAVLPAPVDRAAVARIRGLHQQYRFAGDDTTDYCAHCNQISGGWIPWPCPTLRALDGDEAAAGRVADDTQAEAKPGCAHCGGPHAWDDCEAYTALVQQDGEGDEDEALRAKVDEATATLRRIRALTKDWDSRVLPRSQAHRLLIEVCDALAGPRPDRDRSAVGGAQQQEDDRG